MFVAVQLIIQIYT